MAAAVAQRRGRASPLLSPSKREPDRHRYRARERAEYSRRSSKMSGHGAGRRGIVVLTAGPLGFREAGGYSGAADGCLRRRSAARLEADGLEPGLPKERLSERRRAPIGSTPAVHNRFTLID